MKETALKVVKVLQSAGFIAGFVGGCVRDEILGRVPKDYDVTTNAMPREVQRLFHKTIPVGESFGVMIVVEDDIEIEVATFRKDGAYKDGRRPSSVDFAVTVEDDVLRRDFTINGLFLDPFKDEKIFDWVGGIGDIQKKVIAAIGKPEDRIQEDKLRMLRAIRFYCELEGFTLCNWLRLAIGKHCDEIKLVAKERVRDELFKILASPRPVLGIETLDELGLLENILPEVTQLKGCKQDPIYHPEGDVWTHTLLVLESLRDQNSSTICRFSGLLHDIGKFTDREEYIDEEGRRE